MACLCAVAVREGPAVYLCHKPSPGWPSALGRAGWSQGQTGSWEHFPEAAAGCFQDQLQNHMAQQVTLKAMAVHAKGQMTVGANVTAGGHTDQHPRDRAAAQGSCAACSQCRHVGVLGRLCPLTPVHSVVVEDKALANAAGPFGVLCCKGSGEVRRAIWRELKLHRLWLTGLGAKQWAAWMDKWEARQRCLSRAGEAPAWQRGDRTSWIFLDPL